MKTHLTALLILAVILLGVAVFLGIIYILAVQNPRYLFWLMMLVCLGTLYIGIYKSLKDKEEDKQVGPFNNGGRD